VCGKSRRNQNSSLKKGQALFRGDKLTNQGAFLPTWGELRKGKSQNEGFECLIPLRRVALCKE